MIFGPITSERRDLPEWADPPAGADPGRWRDAVREVCAITGDAMPVIGADVVYHDGLTGRTITTRELVPSVARRPRQPDRISW